MHAVRYEVGMQDFMCFISSAPEGVEKRLERRFPQHEGIRAGDSDSNHRVEKIRLGIPLMYGMDVIQG